MLIYRFSRYSIILLITDTFSLVTQVLDYLFSFFSFFVILVKFCAYKLNIFVVIVSIISLIRPSIHHHQFQLSHESRDCLARILLMLIYRFSRYSIILLITDTFSLVTQVLDYLFSFFSFFVILVKFCAYKLNCFIQIF